MRVSRNLLVSESEAQVFHVVSRVVDKRFIFEEKEKAFFLSLMRGLESFSGVEILSYCLMGNHFHILLNIPAKPKEISIEEVRRRMSFLYSNKKIREFDALIKQMKESGFKQYENDFYDRQKARMFDLSCFMKELKERFSKWYNARTERTGTLWESRFKSLLVERDSSALTNVAAYIELNPVRAGIVSEPSEYRWCSYTEAVAGGKKARLGIARVVGAFDKMMTWKKASSLYRGNFIQKGASQNHRRKGFDDNFAHQELKKGGELSEPKVMETKVRYFTEGLVLGSKAFVEEFARTHPKIVAEKRKGLGVKVKEIGLFSFRDVK